tara:strand:- start:277 stop:444 length:168 start_codon:yes stop_codon:yes gene_type:complete
MISYKGKKALPNRHHNITNLKTLNLKLFLIRTPAEGAHHRFAVGPRVSEHDGQHG